MFAIEAESWTRMPSDKQLGLARGVIYSVAASFDIPIVQITAKDVKHFLTGSKKASKEDVLTALSERSNLEKELAHLPRGQWQHAADAAGCALYAWECSELARLYRRTILSP
jgi:Holliday junction resolvasome RuvABC endonuclease subunit